MNATEIKLEKGLGKIWEMRPGTWGYTHPDGSEGVATSFEEAEFALNDIDDTEKVRRDLASKFGPSAKVCDLPDSEFITGGLLAKLADKLGYAGGRAWINEGNLWSATVSDL